MTGRPVRIPPRRVAQGRRKIVKNDIQKNGEGRNDHQELWPFVFSYHSGEKERQHYSFLC